ncbi:MAG TPA: zinc finger CCHC domain-containing protein, partial [Ktedonobacteraceae bacterium]
MLRRAWRTNAGGERPQLAKLGIKLSLPDAYKGASNTEQFEEWLGRLLRWFRTYGLDEDTPDMDEVRCQVLGQAVKGKVSSFLQRYQDEQEARRLPMDFKSVILAIQDRFLYRSTALDAAQKYETLSQGTRDVQTLADDLRRFAERMAEPPSSYSIRRRFVQALKPGIAQWMLRLGASPETHSLNKLVAFARNIEESDQYARTFQGITAPKAPVPAPRPHPPYGDIRTRPSFGTRSSRPPGAPSRPSGGQGSSAPQVAAGQRPGQPSQLTNVSQRPVTARPVTRGPSVPRPNQTQAGATGVCFNCGVKGHYASNCPMPRQKPQGFAAQIVDDNDNEKNLVVNDQQEMQDAG